MTLTGAWLPLVSTADVPLGEMYAVTVGANKVVIYNIEGEFYATDNVCSHAYALLSEGWLDGHVIECPLHAGQFDVRTGKALCAPVMKDVASFETQVKDGKVEVFLPGAIAV